MDFNVVVTNKEIDDELFLHGLVREDLTTEELASLRHQMEWDKAGGATLDGVLWIGRLPELSLKRRFGQLGMMSYDQSKLRCIIEKCLWMSEKTKGQTSIEHIEKNSCTLTTDEFQFFWDTYYNYGKMEWIDSSLHQYLYFDDYKYWMKRGSAEEIAVIHRQKVSPQK